MSSTRLPSAVGSGAAHLLLLGAVLLVGRHAPVVSVPPAAVASLSMRDIVWPLIPGPSGGGGGGGRRDPAPARRAEDVGRDRASVRAGAPPALTADSNPAVPIDAPLVPVERTAAATELHPGVLDDRAAATRDSRGPGRDDSGAGDNSGGGAGPGPGAGADDGDDRGWESGVFEPGTDVVAPRLLYRKSPLYTDRAMRARVAGTVLLECVVRPDGSVGRVRVLRSLDATGLDEEAVRAGYQWRFAPGTRRGQPVAVRVTIEMAFSIH